MLIVNAIRRLVILAVQIYLLTLAGILVFAASFENPQTPARHDAIVCLGAGVASDGTINAAAIARAKTCAALYRRGLAPLIVMTGGNNVDDAPSGAGGMAAIAVKNHVPVTAIRLEERSRSTLQNALFSVPLLSDAQSILIVTEGFHLPRSKATFALIGGWDSTLYMSEAFRWRSDGRLNFYMLHREALAVWFNLGRYVTWKAAKSAGWDEVDNWLD